MNRQTFLRRSLQLLGLAAIAPTGTVKLLAPATPVAGDTTVVFPTGSFVFVEGGTLELGIVMDSIVNITNDGEVFEHVPVRRFGVHVVDDEHGVWAEAA